MAKPKGIRHLILVLGDQLNADSSAFDGFDVSQDAIWMAEVVDESTYVWSAKQRIVIFLAAMRHFRDERLAEGKTVYYTRLTKNSKPTSLAEQLAKDLQKLKLTKVILVQPGEYRLQDGLSQTIERLGVGLEIRPDRHFMCSLDDFSAHAEGRKQLRMEFFYREMRKRHDVLMDQDKPEGGEWNFDASNRKSFGSNGPELNAEPLTFSPDDTTSQVIDLVKERFRDHPGSVETFRWAVSRKQALQVLDDFIQRRLPNFGDYQDAMWTKEPFLFHSLVSSCLNLKLLDPREVIQKAEDAYQSQQAPLAAVEGFIRQILGWREYVRGVYWRFMPDYLERNGMEAEESLPDFYWTGETDMQCLKNAINQTLEHGYAHHIQRLMVTGLYSLLLGVRPQEVHAWYLAVYVDAVEWVELPNTLGMSQYGDGGVMASKPYVASGSYIDRMSNYCRNCRFNPKKATGDDACPFTTLYWDYLARHRDSLKSNRRMSLQLRNLDRKPEDELDAIQSRAASIKKDPAMTGCSNQKELSL
ncbi:MAG: cryptochrome/photolyase family protein [Verrucomicrobiota bacterium]